jgi:3-oxoacyl-[acyl-carrier-protein] synthase-3
MLNSKINNARIAGISTVVPKNELRLTDDKTLYGGDEKQLKKVMKSSGFDRRRVVDSGTTAADLCQRAAEILLADMKIAASSVGAVVFVTQTPDYHMPATACLLQDKLGIPQGSAAFDVNQGCAGYTYGLWLASLIASSGVQKVLLLVGDTSSKYTDMFREHNSAPIFGDAGSATLVVRDEGASPVYFDIGTDGGNFDVIMARNGGFRNIPSRDMFHDDGSFRYGAQMDGMKVMEFTLDKVPASIADVMDYAGVQKEDIDYFVMHQANKFILENIAFNSDIPMEKMPVETISKYGNTSCTSIPTAICDQLRDKIGGVKAKVLLSGFGIGLSWVSCIVDLDGIYCSNINEY